MVTMFFQLKRSINNIGVFNLELGYGNDDEEAMFSANYLAENAKLLETLEF